MYDHQTGWLIERLAFELKRCARPDQRPSFAIRIIDDWQLCGLTYLVTVTCSGREISEVAHFDQAFLQSFARDAERRTDMLQAIASAIWRMATALGVGLPLFRIGTRSPKRLRDSRGIPSAGARFWP